MTNKEFKHLFMDAMEADDWETYFAECCTNIAFESFVGTDEAYCDYVTDVLRNIWEASHLNIQKIVDRSGLSIASFAERFVIPYRTLQDWYAKRYTPPKYIVLMLAELCGLVTLDREPLPEN